MKTKDIIIGKYYRLKSAPNYGWIKPLKILKPNSEGNENSFIVVKAEHSVDKDDVFGFIRLFRLDEILDNKS